MKWRAIAYRTLNKHYPTKYKGYQEMLRLTSQLQDNPTLKKIYGTDYYFSHFFNDFYCNEEREFFEEMLEVIRSENIDKVFVFDIFQSLGEHNLCLLSKVCRDLNVELLFPNEMKDNIAHKEIFDILADAI